MKIAIIGYGRMGHAVEEIAIEAGHDIVCRMDPLLGSSEITRESLGGAEVAIEFSVPDAAADNICAIAEAGVDVVVGTTGWHTGMGKAVAVVKAANTGLIHAPNFSLGVHLFMGLVRKAARQVNAIEDYDLHVLEEHHKHKIDCPSGTAIHLADMLVEEIDRKKYWSGSSSEDMPEPEVLSVFSKRTGEIPGTHIVKLEGPDDCIEFRHESHGRVAYARGAVQAAEWIQGRSGVFTLDDMLKLKAT